MERIIIEIIGQVGLKRTVRVFDKKDISIGRGYANDLILPDDCVDAEHLRVSLLDDGSFCVEDRHTRNGTFLTSSASVLLEKDRLKDPRVVSSGQMVMIGHTVLRLLNASHPVSEARLMANSSAELMKITPLRMLCYAFAGAAIFYFLHIWENVDELRVSVSKILFIEVVLFLVLMLWPGFWALLGRLITHRMRFISHLTVTLVYSLAVIAMTNVIAYVGYFWMNDGLEIALQVVFGGAAFAWLFFQNISYATNLSLRVRLTTSLMIPAVLAGLMVFGVMMSRESFKPEPPYYARLKPSYVPVHRVVDIDTAISRAGAVLREAADQEASRDAGVLKFNR